VAHENDYRIVPGQRLGRYELGKPAETFGLGNPSGRWEGTGRFGPYYEGQWFEQHGIRVYICKTSPNAVAIIAWRVPSAPSESQAEAAKYRTAQGVGIGSAWAEVVAALGEPESSAETVETVGGTSLRLVVNDYGTLRVYLTGEDRRVIAIGPMIPGGWWRCEGELAVAQAMQAAAQAPALVPERPLALTACEARELWLQLTTDGLARRLAAPVFTTAEQAMDEPPSPVAVLQIQDLIPTDPRVRASAGFYRDGARVESLGYAYAATGQPRFSERAARYLEAWAQVNQPDGRPINETEISRFARGFSLVRETLSPSARALIERWLARMATAEINTFGREYGQDSDIVKIGNHHSHRLKVVGMIGYALDDKRFIQYSENGYRKQIGDNLRPDGSSVDFHHRDALHYHVYNVLPLLELAIAADKHGVALHAYRASSGASLERSIAFLLPYVREEKVHREFVRSPVPLDHQRAAAGIPGFQGPWDPRRGAVLLEMAGYFNPAFANEPIRGYVRRTFQTVLNGLRASCGGR
jgi:hypothetical protein